MPPQNLFHNCFDIRKLLSVLVGWETGPSGDGVEFGLSTTLNLRVQSHSEKEGFLSVDSLRRQGSAHYQDRVKCCIQCPSPLGAKSKGRACVSVDNTGPFHEAKRTRVN